MGDKKPFSTPNAYARNRRGAKIAGIVGGLCVAAVGVVSLIAFMIPSTGFVAQINFQRQAEEAAKLRLRGNKSAKGDETKDKALAQGSQILRYESMKNAVPGQAEDVLAFLKNTELDGAQVIPHEADGYNIGMAYTFYLSNPSPDDVIFNLGVTYDNHISSTVSQAGSLFSYLRILVVVDDGVKESHNWFALAGTTLNDEGNSREPISRWSENADGTRTATFADGDTYYCENFNVAEKQLGYLSNLTIKAGKETRFTVVVYPEGWDPDCKGVSPNGESLAICTEFSVIPPEN